MFPFLCPSRGRAHARRVGSPARRVGSFRGYYLAPKKLYTNPTRSEGSVSEPSLARRVSMC